MVRRLDDALNEPQSKAIAWLLGYLQPTTMAWISKEALIAIIMARTCNPNAVTFESLAAELARYPTRVRASTGNCRAERCSCLFDCDCHCDSEYLVPCVTPQDRDRPYRFAAIDAVLALVGGRDPIDEFGGDAARNHDDVVCPIDIRADFEGCFVHASVVPHHLHASLYAHAPTPSAVPALKQIVDAVRRACHVDEHGAPLPGPGVVLVGGQAYKRWPEGRSVNGWSVRTDPRDGSCSFEAEFEFPALIAARVAVELEDKCGLSYDLFGRWHFDGVLNAMARARAELDT